MKRFGIVILVLMAFAMGSLSLTNTAMAWDPTVEHRIYMGLTIPGGSQPCTNEQAVAVYGGGRGVLPELGNATVGVDGFATFRAWVDQVHGDGFGYTVFDTKGFWDGAREDSRVMLVIGSTDKARAIAEMYQKAFCQDAVYVNSIAVNSESFE